MNNKNAWEYNISCTHRNSEFYCSLFSNLHNHQTGTLGLFLSLIHKDPYNKHVNLPAKTRSITNKLLVECEENRSLHFPATKENFLKTIHVKLFITGVEQTIISAIMTKNIY